jgi:hypothetical protein
MYNIVDQCIDIEKQTSVAEDGSIVPMKATHLLLTEDQYNTILRSVGINANNMDSKLKHLYGLEVIITDVPIEEPRVLSMNK